MTSKIVRSMLFTPADNPSRMRDAAETEADACIFDLEDAIPKHRQEESRQNLIDITSEVDFGDKQVFTRIENTGTQYWLEDLFAAAEAGVDGISIPKVESTYDVHLVNEAVKQMTENPPKIKVGIESPEGVYSGAEIARFCKDKPLVTGISFGSADYCREIGTPEISDQVKDFMSHVFIGYAALGDLTAWASGTLEINNLERLRTLLEQQRELGYTASTCIHPKQIATINEVFTPSEQEYEQAKQLVEGYDNFDGDSIVINDVFLDTATADRYRELITRYERAQGMDT